MITSAKIDIQYRIGSKHFLVEFGIVQHLFSLLAAAITLAYAMTCDTILGHFARLLSVK